MYKNLSNEPQRNKRVFLRIPARLSARLFISEDKYIKTRTDNLSSTGVSFCVNKDIHVPDFLKIHFRIPGYILRIKINLEVINRNIFRDKLRVGCRFVDLPKRAKKIILSYIVRYTNISLPCSFFSIATCLVFLDSLWRAGAFLAGKYYAGAPFNEGSLAGIVSNFYLFPLIGYVILSFAAFFYSGDIKKKNLLISIYYIVPALLFLLVKDIIYLKMNLWRSPYLFIRTFFWAEITLLIYAVFVLLSLIRSLKRIYSLSKSLKEHERYRTTPVQASPWRRFMRRVWIFIVGRFCH